MTNKLLGSLTLLVGVGLSGAVQANCPTGINFNFNQSVQFGDGFSQSLSISGLNVNSSPGQIGDCIVVATGPNGGPVTDNGNTAAIDNAYATPNASANPYFRTGDPVYSPDPAGGTNQNPINPQFTGDSPTTWDVRISTLQSYLGSSGGDLNTMLFYFNHNQENANSNKTTDAAHVEQDLFVWAQIILRDDQSGATKVFDFTSMVNALNLANFGIPFGTTGFDATGANYTSPGIATNTYPSGSIGAGTFPQLSDFVRAQGQICLGGDGSPGNPIVPCDGSGGAVGKVYNENLGANDVANAVFFPELQAILSDPNSIYDTMQIDLRMGCNPALLTCPAGSILNNGYEQLFIVAAAPMNGFCETHPDDPICQPTIPEPATLALMGLGLVGLGLARRKAHPAL